MNRRLLSGRRPGMLQDRRRHEDEFMRKTIKLRALLNRRLYLPSPGRALHQGRRQDRGHRPARSLERDRAQDEERHARPAAARPQRAHGRHEGLVRRRQPRRTARPHGHRPFSRTHDVSRHEEIRPQGIQRDHQEKRRLPTMRLRASTTPRTTSASPRTGSNSSSSSKPTAW